MLTTLVTAVVPNTDEAKSQMLCTDIRSSCIVEDSDGDHLNWAQFYLRLGFIQRLISYAAFRHLSLD